jgi:hypothetical protein
VRRLTGEERYRARAGEIAAWSEADDGAVRAAELVEETAAKATSRRWPARA